MGETTAFTAGVMSLMSCLMSVFLTLSSDPFILHITRDQMMSELYCSISHKSYKLRFIFVLMCVAGRGEWITAAGSIMWITTLVPPHGRDPRWSL